MMVLGKLMAALICATMVIGFCLVIFAMDLGPPSASLYVLTGLFSGFVSRWWFRRYGRTI